MTTGLTEVSRISKSIHVVHWVHNITVDLWYMYFIGGVLGDEGEEPLLDRTEDGTAVSPLSTEVSKLSTKPPRKKFKKGECLQVYVIWVILSEPHINSTAQGECDQYVCQSFLSYTPPNVGYSILSNR